LRRSRRETTDSHYTLKRTSYDGARIEKGSDCYFIVFGEFHRRDNDTELLTIKWPDGNISEISYKCRLIPSKLEAKETFELDGKKCSNPIVVVK
jgi:hypothetical protein